MKGIRWQFWYIGGIEGPRPYVNTNNKFSEKGKVKYQPEENESYFDRFQDKTKFLFPDAFASLEPTQAIN